MTTTDRALCLFYAVVALAAFIGCWTQNVLFMTESGQLGAGAFIRACFANHAAASITLDILFFCLSAFVFMGIEAKRLQIRFFWGYVVLSLLVAVSVMFPLFMIARQRRIAATRG